MSRQLRCFASRLRDLFLSHPRGSVDKNVEGRVYVAVITPLAIGVESLDKYLIRVCLSREVELHQCADDIGAGVKRLRG